MDKKSISISASSPGLKSTFGRNKYYPLLEINDIQIIHEHNTTGLYLYTLFYERKLYTAYLCFTSLKLLE